MSEFDDFDRIFEKMITMTRRLPETDLVAGSQQPSAPPEEPERDEMLEGKDSITYIVDVSGCSEEDLNVSVAEDEIAVRSPDFAVKKRFPVKVDASSTTISFNNGILNVRVRKQR